MEHNYYPKVVKWKGSYSTSCCGTRQGRVLSPYLLIISINQLLLVLNNCDAGVKIGGTLHNYMENQSCGLVTNVYIMENCLIYLVMYLPCHRYTNKMQIDIFMLWAC